MCKFKKTFSVVLALLLALSVIPFTGSCIAAKTGIIFNGVYRTTGNKLTVTASVDTANTAVSTATFVLKYDTSLLTVSDSSVTFLNTAKKSAVYYSEGYIGADWYYTDTNGSSYGLAENSTPTGAVKITFTLNSGKSFSRLTENSVTVCTEASVLDGFNGYGSDDGVLICSGKNFYDYNSGLAYADINLSELTLNYTRLAGHSRVDTANSIAKSGWDSADTVILANGYNFADALAGGPLSKALDAPILLTANKKALETDILTEIAELSAKKVVILGGSVAVNENIETSLAAKGLTVERVCGHSRYETAVEIAKKVNEVNGTQPDNVFIASGINYPDALAISSIAAITGSPILFINKKGTLDTATASYLSGCGASSAVILGGTIAINEVAESNIAAKGIANVSRIAGRSRFDTALLICTTYNSVFTSDDVCIATGLSFPDALAGGAFAAKKGVPIILVNAKSTNATASAVEYIASKNVQNVYIFGGENALSDKCVKAYCAGLEQ